MQRWAIAGGFEREFEYLLLEILKTTITIIIITTMQYPRTGMRKRERHHMVVGAKRKRRPWGPVDTVVVVFVDAAEM